MNPRRLQCGLSALLFAITFAQASAPPAAPATQTIVIDGTLETAPAYLTVHVQIWDGDQVLKGKATGLAALQGLENIDDIDKLLDGIENAEPTEESFPAYLDTGASAHVLSAATASNFGMTVLNDAAYHETGLHGQVAMGVTDAYTLALSGSSGMLFDKPGQFGIAGREVRFLINRAANPLAVLGTGEINVIGMPAISRIVVEIDPAPMGKVDKQRQRDIDELKDIEGLEGLELLNNLDKVGAGPAVRLYNEKFEPNVDYVVPLKLVDFARRRNPADRGPRPDLAANPVIENITIELGGRSSTGDWLLDTGAPLSLISTEQATAIGLFDANGKPVRPADFNMPLGGIAGQPQIVSGWRLDVLRVPLADGRVLEYTRPYVLVKDVSTTLDSGETITLDGVFGTNFLLPTVSGLGFGLLTDVAPGPFKRIWIDCPRSRLLLEKAE